MWAIGGGFLGWAGMKAWKNYRSGKKNIVASKPDDSIDAIGK